MASQQFEATDPAFEAKVRRSFSQQKIMALLGAELVHVGQGTATIGLNVRDDHSQQHGFVHAGVVATIADSAGGYAGFSLMPPASNILTVEFKVHMLRPAVGVRLEATGTVVRPGRNITTSELSVEAIAADGTRKQCAWGSQTLMRLDADDEGA